LHLWLLQLSRGVATVMRGGGTTIMHERKVFAHRKTWQKGVVVFWWL